MCREEKRRKAALAVAGTGRAGSLPGADPSVQGHRCPQCGGILLALPCCRSSGFPSEGAVLYCSKMSAWWWILRPLKEGFENLSDVSMKRTFLCVRKVLSFSLALVKKLNVLRVNTEHHQRSWDMNPSFSITWSCCWCVCSWPVSYSNFASSIGHKWISMWLQPDLARGLSQ